MIDNGTNASNDLDAVYAIIGIETRPRRPPNNVSTPRTSGWCSALCWRSYGITQHWSASQGIVSQLWRFVVIDVGPVVVRKGGWVG